MITSNPEIAVLPWQALVDEIAKILNKDADLLERNINYYQKIRNLPETDPRKLENLYNKLSREQHRFFYFTEIFFRLQNRNLTNMMNGIEEVFKKQEAISGSVDDSFAIYYHKCQERTQVYYMPL